MPKCASCGHEYAEGDLHLMRTKNNRWVSLCKTCHANGVDVNTLKQHAPVDTTKVAAVDKPLDLAKQLLDKLREHRTNKQPDDDEQMETGQTEMTIHFRLANDNTRHAAVVREYAKDHFDVTSKFEPTKGQLVLFDWNIPLPPALTELLQETADVRAVQKMDDGEFSITFKPVPRQIDDGAKLRHFRRYKCDMPVYYTRDKSVLLSNGRVSNISQGGCQMHLDEELNQGEVVTARLVGGSGGRGDLVGTMRICRVVARDTTFETGCAFVQMKQETVQAQNTKGT